MPAKSKSDYYRAKQGFGVMYQGEQITVNAGEIVPAKSPLLKQLGTAAVAEHFEEVTSFGRWDVEAATAAPGEKRTTKRPRKKAAPKPAKKAEPKPEAPAAYKGFGNTNVEAATAGPGEKRGASDVTVHHGS